MRTKYRNGISKATGYLEVLNILADNKVIGLSPDILREWIYVYGMWCCGDCSGSYHGLPGYDTLQSGRRVSLLQRKKLPPSSRYVL